MTDGRRTLLLLRHAKADQALGKDDVGRELTGKGRRHATAVGEWLVDKVGPLDLVVCSEAVRAQQTWTVASQAGATSKEVWNDRSVYQASADQLLSLVRELPEDTTTVLVVGHAPGLPALADQLAGSSRHQLAEEYSTCGMARLSCDCEWSALAAGSCHLDDFTVIRP